MRPLTATSSAGTIRTRRTARPFQPSPSQREESITVGYDLAMHRSGRHFLQIPGPTNTPDRVLRALAQPTIDHRSGEFAALGRTVLEGIKRIFQTSGPVVIFPASGSGAWEAALVNTLSPGDRVLAFDIGEFARGWSEIGRRIGLEVEVTPGDWRHGVDPAAVESRLREDRDHPPQGGAGRSQRNVDRRDEPSSGDSPRDRSRGPPGAAARRRGVVPGLDRAAPRRLGAGRHVVGRRRRG